MARIYPRGNKLWLTYSIYGKREREPLGLKNNREGWKLARKIKLQKEADLLNGRIPEIKRYRKKTLKVGFEEFLKTKKNRAERTIELYEYAHDKLTSFLDDDTPLSMINDDIVTEFEKFIEFTKRGKKSKPRKTSKNTIEIIFRQLRIIFEYYKKQSYVDRNPFPKKEKTERRINTIPRDELTEILKLLKKQNHEQFRTIKLLLMTGLRVSELIRLKFEDIDFKKNIIHIKNSKGKRVDDFPLYNELRLFFMENWKKSEIKGKVVSYQRRDSLRFFRRFLHDNGFPHYTIHELRKTFLTILANSGMSLFDLQKISRHRDLKTTEKYYLAAEYERIGDRVSSVIYDTIKDTKSEKALKLVQKR